MWNVRIWRHLSHKKWCEPYGLFTTNWISNHDTSYTFRRCLCGLSIKIPLMWHLWKGLCLGIVSSPHVKLQKAEHWLKVFTYKLTAINFKIVLLSCVRIFWPFRVVLCVSMFTRPWLLILFNFTHQTGRKILIIVRQRNIKKVLFLKKKKKLSTFNLWNNGKFLMNQWYCNWTGDIFRASLLWLFHPPIWNLLTVLPA